MAHSIFREEMRQSMQMQDAMLEKTLTEIRADIRAKLAANGTDVTKNDQDTQGDGDQSRLNHLDQDGRQVYRDLFSTGGDLQHVGELGLQPLSLFARACVAGDVALVQEELEKLDQPNDTEVLSPELIKLLETRETAMRLSPLLLVVSMGKNVVGGNDRLSRGQEQVAKLLLRYGARPDARDICGKTVCHYGMGCMATKMTIEVANMCIHAYESSHFLGNEVELHSLKSKEMNGKHGYCRGFVVDTGRRAVYLPYKQETVGIKPQNLKLANGSGDTENRGKLCDIPDRLGAVCLLEVIQGDRADVAKELLRKHNASIDIEDCDGMSARSMSLGTGLLSSVSNMVNKHAARSGKGQRKAERNKCSNCGTTEKALNDCARCHAVQYCSRECQRKHWKASHKAVCSELVQEQDKSIVLAKPSGQQATMWTSSINFQTRSAVAPRQNKSGYRKPRSVDVDEKFYVKVQGGGPMMPLLLYDKTREFEMQLEPGHTGFNELREKVNAEPAFQGRKTYVMASFDKKGRCHVYPGMTTLKTW